MSRHGKLVLLSPQAHVAKVLETTQVDRILPVVYDLEEARRAVRRVENPSA
jgi:anti-anti-sigma regulatory factor